VARRLLCSLALLLLSAGFVLAETVSHDPDVAKGVQQVNDGDYDAAIVTLDAAARRLSGDPARYKDLAQAYLYLGIAYVGKGHEAAAKAKFREAVGRMKDLSLSPAEFPPKVIDLFEAAREEASRSAPPPAAAPVSATPPAKKGGGAGKYLLIGGGVAAAGVGAAVALGGGGNGGSPQPTPTPEPQPAEPRFDRIPGAFVPGQTSFRIPVGPGGDGHWIADLYLEGRPEDFGMEVYDQSDQWVTQGEKSGLESVHLEFDGGPGRFFFLVWCHENLDFELPYALEVSYPAP